MRYTIHVNEVKEKEGGLKGFATVVLGESFKITNIAILENKQTGKLFVSMPRYKSNERDENGGAIYKDICNPTTAEFRQDLYDNILETYQQEVSKNKEHGKPRGVEQELLEFSVTVTHYEREGSNIRGLARVYFEDSFILNNVSIVQGKDKMFVAMPAYKVKKIDEQGKAIYQDVAYPVTKEFREKLYGQIIAEYEKAKQQIETQARDKAEQKATPEKQSDREATPFRQ
jgi:DNA-binding cell septation regulator SpoVG